MKTWVACTITGVVSLMAGAVCGVIYADKKLRAEYEKRSDEEIEETKKALEKVMKSQATMRAKRDASKENAPTEEDIRENNAQADKYKSKHGATVFEKPVKQPTVEEVEKAANEPVIFEKDDPGDVEPFNNAPCVVDVDTAVHNTEDWDVITVSWYGDDQLYEENSSSVDVDETIGRASLDTFNIGNPNHGLCNGDCMYVRVPELKLYYEVVDERTPDRDR